MSLCSVCTEILTVYNYYPVSMIHIPKYNVVVFHSGSSSINLLNAKFVQLVYFTVHTLHYIISYCFPAFCVLLYRLAIGSVLDNYNSQPPKIRATWPATWLTTATDIIIGQLLVWTISYQLEASQEHETADHACSLKLRMASVRSTIDCDRLNYLFFIFTKPHNVQWIHKIAKANDIITQMIEIQDYS